MAAATTLQHGVFAERMLDTRRSAQLQGVVQLLKVVDSAVHTVLLGSALSAIAPLQHNQKQKEGAVGIAVAAQKCARRKAALPLLKLVVCASSMALKEHASMMVAPPVQDKDLSIASNTAERR